MDAEKFWVRPGVVAGLRGRGLRVIAPDRLAAPESWSAEVDHLLLAMPDGRADVVAGSNGCSVAARLAATNPDRVRALLLAWPATAGDPEVDRSVRADMVDLGATDQVADALLEAETIRGVTDTQLAALQGPVGVLGSLPVNAIHQRRTVDALLRLVPGAEEFAACPEPPRPEFAPHMAALVATIDAFVR